MPLACWRPRGRPRGPWTCLRDASLVDLRRWQGRGRRRRRAARKASSVRGFFGRRAARGAAARLAPERELPFDVGAHGRWQLREGCWVDVGAVDARRRGCSGDTRLGRMDRGGGLRA